MRKNLISLLIIITMMAGIVCNSPVSAYAAAWGEGTVEDPYTGEIDKNTLIAGAFYYNFCLPKTVFSGCTIYINGETAATIESKDYYNQTGRFYLCKYYKGSMIEFDEVMPMRFCFYPNITQDEKPQLTIGYAEGKGINNNRVYIRTLRNYEYVLDEYMKNDFKVTFSDNVALPTRTGYKLEGWTKSRDGIVYVDYYIYAEIPVSAISNNDNCRRVYAVWSPYKYTINYYPNTTDSVSGMPSSTTVKYDTASNLPSEIPTREGYTFLGWSADTSAATATWNAGSQIYNPSNDPTKVLDVSGALSTDGGSKNLYAVWKRNAFTVTFDSKGGLTTPDVQNVEPGACADEPAVPTKADYKFLGWTTDSAAATTSTLFDFENTSIIAATTLYAVWEPHDHVWAYAADGNKLCAYCTVDGYNCSYYGTESDLSKAITVEVNAPAERNGSLAYDGNDYEARITDTDGKWSQTFAELPSIQYEYKEFGMQAASYSSVTDTKAAGYYKASITPGDVTAYIEYQIAKQPVTLSVTMDDYEVNSQPSDPSVSGGPDGAAYDYKFKKKGADDSTYSEDVPTTPWGDYTVKATYAGDENHESATATYDFKITPKERPKTISVTMSGYKFGQDTAPTPFITPAASELAENPTVTYKYGLDGDILENHQLWTGDTSELGANITYYMRAVIGATDSYEEYITDPMAFYVEKGEWKVTAPTAKTGLTYNCVGQNLVDAGSTVGNGKYLYSIDRTNYSESIPQAIDAGTHKVFYKVESDNNHNEYIGEVPIEVTIAKSDWTVTAPTAIATSFTGEALELVNAGEVKDANGSSVTGKMLYSLTGNDDYSTTIPTATEVGSYTVYYKVNGDDNHNGYAVKNVTATIEKISRTDMPTVSMDGYTYGQTGSIPAPSLSATLSESPAVTYYYNDADDIDGAEKWENITSTTLDAGTYYMFVCIGETASYRECYTEFKQFTISKADCTDITAPAGLTLKYNGQPQALVSAGASTQGTMKYSLTGSEGDFSTEIPTETTVGTYTIYYKVVGDENHNDSAQDSLTVTIGKGIHNVTAPTAFSLKENGSAQVLISAGSCTTGTLLYSLDDIEYSDSIEGITASAIGTYTVYYKVEGDADYEAFGPKTLTAKITKQFVPIYIPMENPISVTEETQDEKKSEEEKAEPSVETKPEEYTAPVVEYIEQIETGEVSVPVKAEISDGIATVEEITEDVLKDILDEIQNEVAKTEDNASEGQETGEKETDDKTVGDKETDGKATDEVTALTIELSQAAQDVIGVNLSTKTLEAIADVISDDSNAIESVKFEMSEAIVELDAKTLDAVIKSAEGNTVKLVVENTEEESLNKSQSITLKGYDVDRTFEAYFESAGKRIHDFKGGKTLVSLSFKPEKGKRVENYKVFYIDENGKLQKMTTKYESGLITFVTGHFSDYAVIYENVQEVLLAEASTTKKGYIKLSWNEIDGAEKYVVYGAKCGKAYGKLTETDGNSFTIKKINDAKPVSGKTYKLYVVAYDALGNKIKSKTIHYIVGDVSAKYANVKTITALQKTLELTIGEKANVGAEYTMYEDKKHISKSHGKALRFTSDCPDVAKVAKDGTVTAKSEGKAVIYIQDISGTWCTVEVTVKEK